jgi:hypothetical protein
VLFSRRRRIAGQLLGGILLALNLIGLTCRQVLTLGYIIATLGLLAAAATAAQVDEIRRRQDARLIDPDLDPQASDSPSPRRSAPSSGSARSSREGRGPTVSAPLTPRRCARRAARQRSSTRWNDLDLRHLAGGRSSRRATGSEGATELCVTVVGLRRHLRPRWHRESSGHRSERRTQTRKCTPRQRPSKSWVT